MDVEMTPEDKHSEQEKQPLPEAPKTVKVPKTAGPGTKRSREVEAMRAKADKLDRETAQAKAATQQLEIELCRHRERVREMQEQEDQVQQKLARQQQSEAATV